MATFVAKKSAVNYFTVKRQRLASRVCVNFFKVATASKFQLKDFVIR
jgi:hypothetical protein